MMPNPAAKLFTYACIPSASRKRSATATPPGGVSGWSSYPTQISSTSCSLCSLTRLLRSATKQKGQTKSVKSRMRAGIAGEPITGASPARYPLAAPGREAC